MADGPFRVQSSPTGEYAWSRDLLPGAVASAVGYDVSGLTPRLHRGLPSPYLTFIFSLEEPIISGETAREALDGPTRNEVLVAGLASAPTYVVQPRSQAGIQLAVHPLAARAIFGAPTARVPWQATEGFDLLGRDAARVRDQLIESTTWDTRFGILATYLGRRLSRNERWPPPRPELLEAWSWLARRHGSGSMDALAAHVSLSPRQLRALFSAELGVGPKQIGRLMRFDVAKQRIAASIAAGQELRLTEVAARCGYYDHPHLDADFRQFVGVSPRDWVSEERRNIQAGGHRNGEEWDS